MANLLDHLTDSQLENHLNRLRKVSSGEGKKAERAKKALEKDLKYKEERDEKNRNSDS